MTHGGWRGDRVEVFRDEEDGRMGHARGRSRSPPRHRNSNREDNSWHRRDPSPDPWGMRNDSWDMREPSPPPRRKMGGPRRSPNLPSRKERETQRFENEWESGDDRRSGFIDRPPPERFDDPFRRSGGAPSSNPQTRSGFTQGGGAGSQHRNQQQDRRSSGPLLPSRSMASPPSQRNEPHFRRSDLAPRTASPPPHLQRNDPPFRRTGPPRDLSPPPNKRSFQMETFNARSHQENSRKEDSHYLEPRQSGGGFKRPMSPEAVSSFETPFKRQREVGLGNIAQGNYGRASGALTRDSYGGNYKVEPHSDGDRRAQPSPSNRFTTSQRSPLRGNFASGSEPPFNKGAPSSKVWSNPGGAFTEGPFGGNKHARDSGDGNQVNWTTSGSRPSDGRRNVWSQGQERTEFSPPPRPMPWAGDSGPNGNQSGGGGHWGQATTDDYMERRPFGPDTGRRSEGLNSSSQDFLQRSNTSFPSACEPDSSASWYDQVMESQSPQENIFSRLGPSPRRNETVRGWKPTY